MEHKLIVVQKKINIDYSLCFAYDKFDLEVQ